MATKRICGPCRTALTASRDAARTFLDSASRPRRSLATATSLPTIIPYSAPSKGHVQLKTTPSSSHFEVPSALLIPSALSPIQTSKVTTTVHEFPSLEPIAFLEYPATHLGLPLRRDILHRAVTFEADASRQGTANTKWRDEVRGSGRKIRPQKGTGRARLGDKKSPMLKGGGVAFGPKPRSFATQLPRKLYDLAWRTALSYRYIKGELLVVDKLAIGNWGEFWGEEIRDVHDRDYKIPFYVRHLLTQLGLGNKSGRSMLVTTKARKEEEPTLFRSLEVRGELGSIRAIGDVDVKNLLEMGRVVIEKDALDQILIEHQSDLGVEAVAKTELWGQEQKIKEAAELEAALLSQLTSSEELDGMLDEDVYSEDVEVEWADMDSEQQEVGTPSAQFEGRVPVDSTVQR